MEKRHASRHDMMGKEANKKNKIISKNTEPEKRSERLYLGPIVPLFFSMPLWSINSTVSCNKEKGGNRKKIESGV